MILRPKGTNSLSVVAFCHNKLWWPEVVQCAHWDGHGIATLMLVFITVIVRCDQRPQHYSSHKHSICGQMMPQWKYWYGSYSSLWPKQTTFENSFSWYPGTVRQGLDLVGKFRHIREGRQVRLHRSLEFSNVTGNFHMLCFTFTTNGSDLRPQKTSL